MKYLLIGRPNVGKSSIFNILIGNKNSIVHKDRGTTRDWHEDKIYLSNNNYIYDSPGIILDSVKSEEKKIINIISFLINKIEIIFFVIDYNLLFNIQDQIILKWLRGFNKEIILLINKKDNKKTNNNIEYYQYGINKFFFLSCSHKLGFEELNKFINKNNSLKLKNLDNNEEYEYLLAIFGKPNAGKSTFLNTLLGYERSLTSSTKGTTSDYVKDNFIYKSKKIRIYDTAGIGRKSKIIKQSINFHSVNKTLNKIKDVDGSIILIDSTRGLDRQDKRIINLISDKSKSLIVVFNKLDLINNKLIFKKNILSEFKENLRQLKNIKVFFITSFSKKQVYQIIDYIEKNIFIKYYDFNTNMINTWLNKCTNNFQHPLIDKKKVNFKYAVKVRDKPITIKIFCNFSKRINKNYIRYLKNNFHSNFKILNQNAKFIFSQTKNPYSD